MNRIRALDGLRGVAILLVVVFHGWPHLMPAGGYGVTVFFVLSGFLITGILLRDADNGGINYKRFYWNRAVRLVPALVVVLIAFLVVYRNIEPVAWTAFYGANIAKIFGVELEQLSPAWSLAVEEHFYFVWPIVLGLIPKSVRLRATAGLFGVAVGWRVWMAVTADFPRVQYGTDTVAFALLAGCLIAVLQHEDKLPVPSHITTLVAVAGIVAAAVVIPHTDTPILWGALPVVGLSMIATAGCLRPVPVLENSTLVWFGTVSYGLYLWHTMFMWSGAGPLPVMLAGAVVVTWLSYRFVEQPMRRQFHRSGREQPHGENAGGELLGRGRIVGAHL